jgi:hypothetical protein
MNKIVVNNYIFLNSFVFNEIFFNLFIENIIYKTKQKENNAFNDPYLNDKLKTNTDDDSTEYDDEDDESGDTDVDFSKSLVSAKSFQQKRIRNGIFHCYYYV